MSGSGTVQVLKSDGNLEDFDSRKLSAAMWRVIRTHGGSYDQASELGAAMALYLDRVSWVCITSAAVFEMCVKVLRQVGFSPAAEALEDHREWRNARRRRLRVRHDTGKVTLWEKSWLCEFARRSWHLSGSAARIIAGRIEADLLAETQTSVSRQAVVDRLNAYVAGYGLADAVPVQQ